jgi:hypothetical protein
MTQLKVITRRVWKNIVRPFAAIGEMESDRLVAYGTFIVAIATFALGFIAHSTDKKVGRQLDALERQLALAEYDQRPWVYLDSFFLKSSLVITDNDARLTIQISLKNSGKSPAHFVETNLSLIGFIEGDTPQNNANWTACDNLRSKPADSLTGGILMPGAELPTTGYVGMGAANYSHWISKPQGGAMLIGCIDYTGADRRTHHQSRFTFVLGKKVDGRSPDFIDTKPGEIPQSQLELIDHANFYKSAD